LGVFYLKYCDSLIYNTSLIVKIKKYN
jgi:hypothetical protein